MKRKLLFGMLFTAIITFGFYGCSGGDDGTSEPPAPKVEPSDSKETETLEKAGYKIAYPKGLLDTIIIDEEAKTITFAPEAEKTEYTFKGAFDGQIINKTKNTVIILSNATLKNSDGKAAIYGELKTEIKAAEHTINTISTDKKVDVKATVYCEKGLEIGGAGTLTITSANDKTHAVKASKVELKGSGTFTFDGGSDASAINCNEFTVEEEKTFTANLKDSKNGIKADKTIEIASGTFNFENVITALKTDTSKDDKDGETVEHFITIVGGSFTFTNCENMVSTEEGNLTIVESLAEDFE